MGVVMTISTPGNQSPFNSPVEIGLRSLVLLYTLFPDSASLQRLVFFDYLLVHSDDVPDGPTGLHPKTPHRSGEILVRRDNIRHGLLLYMSRDLIKDLYPETGLVYAATERTGSFLDAMQAEYVAALRSRSTWVIDRFASQTDAELGAYINDHLGQWGAEFEMDSVLWSEDIR
jgi:hypothetical protein